MRKKKKKYSKNMNFIRRAVPQLRCVAAARSLTAGPVVSAAKGSGGEVTHTGQVRADF